MEYDELGRVIATTDTADTSVETQFTYDLAGNRITVTDGKSQATTYVYDARGRQISQIAVQLDILRRLTTLQA